MLITLISWPHRPLQCLPKWLQMAQLYCLLPVNWPLSSVDLTPISHWTDTHRPLNWPPSPVELTPISHWTDPDRSLIWLPPLIRHPPSVELTPISRRTDSHLPLNWPLSSVELTPSPLNWRLSSVTAVAGLSGQPRSSSQDQLEWRSPRSYDSRNGPIAGQRRTPRTCFYAYIMAIESIEWHRHTSHLFKIVSMYFVNVHGMSLWDCCQSQFSMLCTILVFRHMLAPSFEIMESNVQIDMDL